MELMGSMETVSLAIRFELNVQIEIFAKSEFPTLLWMKPVTVSESKIFRILVRVVMEMLKGQLLA